MPLLAFEFSFRDHSASLAQQQGLLQTDLVLGPKKINEKTAKVLTPIGILKVFNEEITKSQTGQTLTFGTYPSCSSLN